MLHAIAGTINGGSTKNNLNAEPFLTLTNSQLLMKTINYLLTNIFSKSLFLAVIFSLGIISCSDDDEASPTPTNTNNGNNPPDTTKMDSMMNDSMDAVAKYTVIATDPSGDAGGGLDGTEIEFKYDKASDSISFRITVTDMSSFSSSPSADLSFKLSNGTIPQSNLASPFRGSTTTHRTASIYTDRGGSPPSSYSYSSGGYATNGISFTSDVSSSTHGRDLRKLCAGCIEIFVDEQNNQMILSIPRKQIISDAEIGSTKTATIELVANTGFEILNNDLIADGEEFTITID